MSRILEALKQIEASSPPRQPAERAAPKEPLPGQTEAAATDADEAAATTVETLERDGLEWPEPSGQGGSGPVGQPEPESQVPSDPLQGKASLADEIESAADAPERPGPCAPGKASPEDEIRGALGGPVAGCDSGFRELAANILAQLPAGRPAALLFTSPDDAAGKTATLAPLAALLAERIGGGVLAIDGNLHRPNLAGQFGIATRHGLAAVLRGEVRWQDAIRSTSLDGLRILPAEAPASGGDVPADLSALGPLLDELRRHFRLVLLDAASLAHPEVAGLARCCDGTCLVVRLGQTTHRQGPGLRSPRE